MESGDSPASAGSPSPASSAPICLRPGSRVRRVRAPAHLGLLRDGSGDDGRGLLLRRQGGGQRGQPLRGRGVPPRDFLARSGCQDVVCAAPGRRSCAVAPGRPGSEAPSARKEPLPGAAWRRPGWLTPASSEESKIRTNADPLAARLRDVFRPELTRLCRNGRSGGRDPPTGRSNSRRRSPPGRNRGHGSCSGPHPGSPC